MRMGTLWSMQEAMRLRYEGFPFSIVNIIVKKLPLVTQAGLSCRMLGWTVWKLTQHMLQRFRTKAKRK
jgi:hypothetical protein